MKALGRLPVGLILAGKTATDSAFSALGAEVAGLMDLPLVGPARSITRPAEAPDRLEVVVEGDTIPFRIAPPVVVTVGEKIGRLAARRGVALITGVTGLDPSGPSWVWTKPSFGRDRLASVRARTRPYVVPIRPGAFRAETAPEADPLRRTEAPAPPDGPDRDPAAGPSGPGPRTGYGDLERARVMVVVGSGAGGSDGIARIAELVAPRSAALAAPRRVVDAGRVPAELQVGLTGHSLAPELVLLLGVSGSTHHLCGWRRAGVVAAINPDPAAPVFGDVDVGLVGRWEDLLPELLRAFGPSGPAGPR